MSLQFPFSRDLQLDKLAVESFRSFAADRSGRQTLTIVRPLDAASPALSRALADTAVLPSATLAFTRPGIHPMLVTYVLSDVVITSLRPLPKGESSRGQLEEITLTFSGATMTRVPARPVTSDDCST
jgi:type VI protein secretion system component Hcp